MKQVTGGYRPINLTTILVLACCLASVSAYSNEIYRWTDENGVVHFGDRPPDGQATQTINVPQFQQAESDDSTATPDEPETLPTDQMANANPGEEEPVPLTAAQARREKMAKDRQERMEAQAEIDTMCKKHSKRVEQMEPYRRVFYTNEQGESVRMNDDLRIQLVEESKSYIADNCD